MKGYAIEIGYDVKVVIMKKQKPFGIELTKRAKPILFCFIVLMT